MVNHDQENGEMDLPAEKEEADVFFDEILVFPDEKQHHKWSVSWSDLMMTMFIFFAVMYLYQTGSKDLEFGTGPGKDTLSESGSNSVINININQQSREIYDRTKQAVREIMLAREDDLNLSKNDAVRIVMASDLFFNSGSAALKPGAMYQLNQLAEALSENSLVINVVGHTDDVPSRSEQFPTNWELSSKRAVMVARYLIEKRGIDPERIFVSAHSFYNPVEPNNTTDNRSLNRRVEIVLMKQKPFSG